MNIQYKTQLSLKKLAETAHYLFKNASFFGNIFIALLDFITKPKIWPFSKNTYFWDSLSSIVTIVSYYLTVCFTFI